VRARLANAQAVLQRAQSADMQAGEQTRKLMCEAAALRVQLPN
jgi:hypothetical protein